MTAQLSNISQFSIRAVERLQPKLDEGLPLTPVEKLMVYQALSRNWRRHLTPTEYLVLSYFVDRTVGWGHGYFTASADNVLYGNADFAGVGLGRSSYYRTLGSLEEMGAIRRKSLRDKTRIWIKVDWC